MLRGLLTDTLPLFCIRHTPVNFVDAAKKLLVLMTTNHASIPALSKTRRNVFCQPEHATLHPAVQHFNPMSALKNVSQDVVKLVRGINVIRFLREPVLWCTENPRSTD